MALGAIAESCSVPRSLIACSFVTLMHISSAAAVCFELLLYATSCHCILFRDIHYFSDQMLTEGNYQVIAQTTVAVLIRMLIEPLSLS